MKEKIEQTVFRVFLTIVVGMIGTVLLYAIVMACGFVLSDIGLIDKKYFKEDCPCKTNTMIVPMPMKY
jgi:hypothetical protein